MATASRLQRTSKATIRDTASGVEIDVRVIPRAHRNQVAGVRADALAVRIAAPPIEGAANDALVDVLCEWLAVPRRAVTIVSGERSRLKRVRIAGMTAAAVRAALGSSP